jgi:hypothetical protein
LLALTIASCRRKYKFECTITPETFLQWELGELRDVQVGRKKKKSRNGRSAFVWADHKIPAPYDRIVSQLITEAEHATRHHGHEAVRRQSYALEVLDAFGDEITSYDGPQAAFRSRTLTPILQRHLWGVSDEYGPCVRGAVLDDAEGEPTITMATQFYLSEDPTDPGLIPTYRRNIIYIPEARWHLGVVLGKRGIGNGTSYNRMWRSFDILVDGLEQEAEAEEEEEQDADDQDVSSEGDVPKLSWTEVYLIMHETLEGFFATELERVVLIPLHLLYSC